MTGSRELHLARFIRFVLVGLANTALTFVIFTTLTLAGLHYQASVVASAILGILFSATLNKSFTFGRSGRAHLAAFLGVYVVTVSVNMLLLGVAVNRYELSPILTQALVTLPIAGLTFLLLTAADNLILKPPPEA